MAQWLMSRVLGAICDEIMVNINDSTQQNSMRYVVVSLVRKYSTWVDRAVGKYSVQP